MSNKGPIQSLIKFHSKIWPGLTKENLLQPTAIFTPPLYDFLCDFLSCILLAASPLAARRYRFHEFMACSILLTLIGQIL